MRHTSVEASIRMRGKVEVHAVASEKLFGAQEISGYPGTLGTLGTLCCEFTLQAVNSHLPTVNSQQMTKRVRPSGPSGTLGTLRDPRDPWDPLL